jgi:DNA mismatch repair protein MutS2
VSESLARLSAVKLELPAILARLAERCHFSVAAELAAQIEPSDDIDDVRNRLDLTAEAVDLLTNFPDFSIGGARDVREIAERAQKGGRLTPPELFLVHDMVSASRALRRSFLRLPDGSTRFPRLSDLVVGFADLPGLEANIGRAISPRGDLLDTASDELGRIRRAIRVAHNRLMDRLNSMVSGGKYATALQDAIVTMRDGRYVIPIKTEARHQAPGIVHDASASGQTLFIEPLEVVELNNKWREQQIAEQREIERILDDLTVQVGAVAEVLIATVDSAAKMDVAFAKARLSFDLKATRPLLWRGGRSPEGGHSSKRVILKRARHPLLDPSTVVPTDIELGKNFRILLITGPNTGGKTVALKTTGLLCLMAQCGLFIPADDGSIVSVFPSIFVDIGDEQSIAQSLSTFSSHMRTVVNMLQYATPEDLVLLDELGAGTDPREGSALARAIIADLLNRGPLVMATTHYSEVKTFAHSTPGVENASVEFDVKSLAPTYRLTIGVPGRSNALAIARRLGMPKSVLDSAATMVDPTEVRADALLEDIRRRRDEAEAMQHRAEETRAEADRLRSRAKNELKEAERERRDAREEALAAAEQELGEARQALRRLERERAIQAPQPESPEINRQAVEHAAATMRRIRREVAASRPAATGTVIRPGDRVEIVPLGQEGDVLSVTGTSAEIQMGSLKVRQDLTALRRIGRAQIESQQRVFVSSSSPVFVPMEIDVRGQRAGELVPVLEKYLDEAARFGLPSVRIIHGKGTGVLRQVVGNYLRESPVVAKSELAPQNEGGDGATVAYLRVD